MTPVSSHILQLLYNTDCVIVPHFGAFVASYVSASFDATRGIMLPPRKELVFNKHLAHNDGTLANYISQCERISFSEATLRVDSFVASTKRKLSTQNVVLIAGIGSLTCNGETIVFKPESNNFFCTTSYGLAPLPLVAIKPNTQPVITWRAVRQVAISAAMIVGLLLVSPGVRDGELTKSYQQANLIGALAPMNNTSAKPTQSVDASPQAVALAQPKFHIVVASFATQAEASKYIGQMQQRGISGLMSKNSNGRQRIIAASFTTHQEAKEHNKAFRSLPDFEKAWVWCE